jgi:integrase
MNALTTIADTTMDPTFARNLAAYWVKADKAFTPNTKRALEADTRLYVGWCIEARLCSLPAQPATVAAFIMAMSATKKPATIRRYVASIAHMHRAAEAPNPCKHNDVTLALKTLHHERRRKQKQAKPMIRKLVDAALRPMPAYVRLPVRTLRNRAMLAVAYDSLCRASELVALRVEDIEADPHDGSAVIAIGRSKTDQEGEGMVRYLARDTMAHVSAWLKAADITHTSGPLFRAVLKGGIVEDRPLHVNEVTRIFREVAPNAGRISAHSTRVGAAVDMVEAGVDLGGIMLAGGWKSATMVARYAQGSDARRAGAAKLAVLQKREPARPGLIVHPSPDD